MKIKREISLEFKKVIEEYPVVTILGPRQAGKTTLCQDELPGYEYSNLEHPETRQFAEEDPVHYLAQFKNNVIIDEIQRVPTLLSYIQVIVDKNKRNGQFVLTGSHQLQLQEAVSQSLAGRTAILNLLPLSIKELSDSGMDFADHSDYCFNGFLPKIYNENIRAHNYYSNYYQTYVERDVKLLINLKDLSLFEKFLKIMATRVGQLIDYASLANAIGVDAKTIKNWLSILEASYILFKLSPYYENFGKRIIKSQKYYFTDVGLLSFLLGIENKEQIARDPLRGNLFENLVIIEAIKTRYNQGKLPNLYFYRDSNGNEVDLIWQNGRNLVPIEIKSAQTFHTNFKNGIIHLQKITSMAEKGFVIYSGDSVIGNAEYAVLNYKKTYSIF